MNWQIRIISYLPQFFPKCTRVSASCRSSPFTKGTPSQPMPLIMSAYLSLSAKKLLLIKSFSIPVLLLPQET